MVVRRLRLALTGAVALILATGLALIGWLDQINFQRTHSELLSSRMMVQGDDLRHWIESGLDLGLPPAQLAALPAQMAARVANDPDLLGIRLLDQRSQTQLLAGNPAATAAAAVAATTPLPLSNGAGRELRRSSNHYLLQQTLHNSFGQAVGQLLLSYDRRSADAPLTAMAQALLRYGLVTLLLSWLLLLPLLRWQLRQPFSSDLHHPIVCHRHLLLPLLLLIGGGMLLYSILNLQQFRSSLEPTLHHKAQALAAGQGELFTQLLERGIEADEWRGIEPLFTQLQEENSDISYLLLTDSAGQVVRAVGTLPTAAASHFVAVATNAANRPLATLPLGDHYATHQRIGGAAAPVGWIQLGQHRDYIDQQVARIQWDLLTVLLVTLLIAFELLLFVLVLLARQPLSVAATPITAESDSRASATSLPLIRWPFFLLIFAEALSVSFLPLYAQQFDPAIAWLSPTLLSGLPISLFMLVWAISMPFAGSISDQIGRRRAFALGSLIAAAGLVATASVSHFWSLLLWRGVTALGYSLVFVTAQGYVVDQSPPQQRTAGMAMFLAAFFGGSLCGAAMGGIVAERLGYAPLFTLAALLALLAAGVALTLLEERQQQRAVPPPLRWQPLRQLLQNRRFLALTLLAAVPAKLILTGVLYYAMPLYLVSLTLDGGDVGRAIMSYGLAMILFSPLVGRFADRWGGRDRFVVAGTLLAALSLLLLPLEGGIGIVVGAVLLLGLAQAISVAPQLVLVLEVSREDAAALGAGTLIGIFRLLERGGSVLGPLLVALLVTEVGFADTFRLLSLYLLLSTLLLGWLWRQREPTAVAVDDQHD